MATTVLELNNPPADGGRLPADQAAERILQVIPALFRQIMADVRLSLPATSADIGETQFRMIHSLSHRAYTMGEMAECMKVRAPTVSRMVDTLVERGYVDRRPDSADRRKVWLGLTPQGRALAGTMESCFRAVVARLLQPLDAAQLAGIVVACNSLESAIPGGRPQDTRFHSFEEDSQ